MALEAISGAAATPADSTTAPSRAAAGSAATEFAATLQRHLSRPRSDISVIRSEIDAIRAGDPFWNAPIPSMGTGTGSSVAGFSAMPGWLDAQLAGQATGDEGDPYGWRSMARGIGESVIGPGYGALFERQIDQESGFAADVVYGTRVSTAGAEGIAQLMPQYYPNVNRLDPQSGLMAGAETMRHYLNAWDGDVRKALASYNCGLGRVQQVVVAHGANWEAALPAETQSYLHSILGDAAPRFDALDQTPAAVFTGRGPGGVLTAPLEGAATIRASGTGVDLFGAAGAAVRAPADGVVVEVVGERVVIDHGNGWRSALDGVVGSAAVGATVRRSDPVGMLGAGGMLSLGLTQGGTLVDPSPYLLGAVGTSV